MNCLSLKCIRVKSIIYVKRAWFLVQLYFAIKKTVQSKMVVLKELVLTGSWLCLPGNQIFEIAIVYKTKVFKNINVCFIRALHLHDKVVTKKLSLNYYACTGYR